VEQLGQPNVDRRRLAGRRRDGLRRRGLLAWDAGRLSDDTIVAYFRIRAVAAGVVAGVIAFVGLFVARNDARYLFDGLTSRALPLVVVSVLAGLAVLVLLRGRPRRGGRLAAVVAAGALVLGWGVAQWDYLLPESLTVSQAAAPTGTIVAVLVATVLAMLLIVPSCCTRSTRRAYFRRKGQTRGPTRQPESRVPESGLIVFGAVRRRSVVSCASQPVWRTS
jgi:cytochrome d ubiquinol oxidase subunit II